MAAASRIVLIATALVLALYGSMPVMAAVPPSSHLPLEVRPGTRGGDTLVVFYSGDGGWAAFDETVSSDLVSQGLPVVGINSLRYFWTRQTPKAAAADLAEVLRYYLATWNRSRVVLVGYSFGAGALPAIVPQLPADLRARVRLVALVSVEARGDLQFHPGGWLNLDDAAGYDVVTLLGHQKGPPLVCIYGGADAHAACPALPEALIHHIRLTGGHHYGSDVGAVSRAIVAAIPR